MSRSIFNPGGRPLPNFGVVTKEKLDAFLSSEASGTSGAAAGGAGPATAAAAAPLAVPIAGLSAAQRSRTNKTSLVRSQYVVDDDSDADDGNPDELDRLAEGRRRAPKPERGDEAQAQAEPGNLRRSPAHSTRSRSSSSNGKRKLRSQAADDEAVLEGEDEAAEQPGSNHDDDDDDDEVGVAEVQPAKRANRSRPGANALVQIDDDDDEDEDGDDSDDNDLQKTPTSKRPSRTHRGSRLLSAQKKKVVNSE